MNDQRCTLISILVFVVSWAEKLGLFHLGYTDTILQTSHDLYAYMSTSIIFLKSSLEVGLGNCLEHVAPFFSIFFKFVL